MSSASSVRPVFSETFLYFTRAPVFLSSWWKWTVWSREAVNALTGTLTRPKLIDPFQVGRGMQIRYPECRRERSWATALTAHTERAATYFDSAATALASATLGSRLGSPFWPIDSANALSADMRASSETSAFMIRSTDGVRSRYCVTSRCASCWCGAKLSTSTVPSYHGVVAGFFDFFATAIISCFLVRPRSGPTTRACALRTRRSRSRCRRTADATGPDLRARSARVGWARPRNRRHRWHLRPGRRAALAWRPPSRGEPSRAAASGSGRGSSARRVKDDHRCLLL